MIKGPHTLLFIWLYACGMVYAQVQTRSDLIDAARSEKEANLTPQVAPKGQLRLESIEQSLAYRLLTADANGFGVGFGSIVPGAGFAVGPQYTRTGLWDDRLTVSIQARAAANESYVGRVGLLFPRLFGGRGSLDFSATHRNISEMPYYGFGPESRNTGRSDYRLEDTKVELRPGIHIYKGLEASLIGSFLAVNVGPGHSSRYISTERQFGPYSASGIDRQTNFWRGGAMLAYDYRNSDSNPTSGGRYAAQYVRYLDADVGGYSFLRLDLDAAQYVPLFNHTRVIALHGATSLTTTRSTQQVPFYLQPTLGGPDTLRGYRFDRFYGNNSTLLTAEYRWEASPLLEMVAFTDAGKVFNDWNQWNYHKMQSDVGFGLRFKNPDRVVFSFETAFSHEGFQIWFRMNSTVHSRDESLARF